MPTLQTLYDLLCSQPEGEAVRLATALEIYVSGSLNAVSYTHLGRSAFACSAAAFPALSWSLMDARPT